MELIEVSEALIAFNQLKERGVIEDYAIGGGYAAIYHQIPYSTYDLDIFVIISGESGLDILHSVYKYFRENGYRIEGEHIKVGDTAVQILPNISPLSNNAVKEACKAKVDGIPAKVIGIEHLIALSLVAFRWKDKIRIINLLEKADKNLLKKVLDRFGNEENQLHQRYKEVLASS